MAIRVGSFVSWRSSGGTARGKITELVTDGEVNGIAVKITGTKDDPAAKIQIWEAAGDAWRPTKTFVGHKTSTLTEIEPLKEAKSVKAAALNNLGIRSATMQLQCQLAIAQSMLTVEAAESTETVTDFPTKGDKLKVSLRNSQWGLFPLAYAQDLKDNWPQIWSKGGNILGNRQFTALSAIAKNGGVPKEGAEETAVRKREAWAARHYGDHRIAGVVAQIKWLVVGELGEAGMKKLINEEKTKLKEKAKS